MEIVTVVGWQSDQGWGSAGRDSRLLEHNTVKGAGGSRWSRSDQLVAGSTGAVVHNKRLNGTGGNGTM